MFLTCTILTCQNVVAMTDIQIRQAAMEDAVLAMLQQMKEIAMNIKSFQCSKNIILRDPRQCLHCKAWDTTDGCSNRIIKKPQLADIL
jgi:hypothetical protein